jgi:sugar/nucleoside kinase (ribokinase family)
MTDDEKTQVLHSFLGLMHYVMPNLNDTFSYATADTERLYMDGAEDEEVEKTNQAMLVDVFIRWGAEGVWAYCAKVRGDHVNPTLHNARYEEALAYMEGWEYEPD